MWRPALIDKAIGVEKMDLPASPALLLQGISKAYPGVQALYDVDFECRGGEIHGLLGANGSGKSTLVGIASGAIAPDVGRIEIFGERLTVAHPAVARYMGLATVYQDNSLILDLSVAQNLFLSALRHQRPKCSQMESWAREQIRDCLSIESKTQVSDLSVGVRQLLEVVKALVLKPKVLLLDEPTSALGPADVAYLHTLMRQVAATGTGVVYVSHRLSEVLQVADRITVLRDGLCRGTFPAKDLTIDDAVTLMVGNPLEIEFPPKHADPNLDQEVVLSASGLVGARFGPVNLNLYKREILGLAGAEGNGQREILRAIAGLEQAKGSITFDAQRLRLNSVENNLRAGIIMLSGDRARDSLFAVLSVRENMGIHILGSFCRWGLLVGNQERVAVTNLVDRLSIVTPSIELPVRFLSGGNQQKVVMGRAFLYPARVILVDEPTQGVDAKARLDIHRTLRAKAREGICVLINSSDAHELAGLCDRVLVVSRGHIVKELSGPDLTEKNIVSAFVTSEGSVSAAEASTARHGLDQERPGRLQRLFRSERMPLVALIALMLLVGGYTSTQSEKFLTSLNIRHLLAQTIPLAFVGMAQLNVLLVGGFDISVGSLMSVIVVLGSFLIIGTNPPLSLVSGALICLAAGLIVGLVNGILVRGFRITPVIATIATLSILQGIALLLRPRPEGPISREFLGALTVHLGFVPWAFIVLLVGALVGDIWLYRTAGGLATRAIGFREEAARRIGISTSRAHMCAYLLSGLLAAIGGLFLASEVGVGMPTAGAEYTLKSIAAAVLGGASLFGGRGSFLGCLLGALFLCLMMKIVPFLEIRSAFGIITTGVVTLVAILLYSGGASWLSLAKMRNRKAGSGAPAVGGD